MNNDFASFLAFGFGFLALALIVKNYIDSKFTTLERGLESQERLMFDEVQAVRNCVGKRIDNIEREMDQNRSNVWREIDSLWDNKEAKLTATCDKAMSKNYYNSDAGGCCKTAQEYLKG